MAKLVDEHDHDERDEEGDDVKDAGADREMQQAHEVHLSIP
jgi:hypothetical protein